MKPLILSALLTLPAFAQQRPIPYPVIPSPQFEQAVERGTRTADGHPGEAYWTNTAAYTMHAQLDPETKVLKGSQIVTYTNNSPDNIALITVHLRQNLHQEGAIRNRPQQLTGGMTVDYVSVGDRKLEAKERLINAGYSIEGTLMYIRLPEPLLSGNDITLSIDWSFEVPEAGAPRMGQDGEVFYLAYWYPQIAVYDDLFGWKADQYMGNGEFYMGYADYDVTITVPDTWLVGATGILQNGGDMLTQQTRDRLQEASTTKETIHVVMEADKDAGSALLMGDSGTHSWNFVAERVRDFAFGTSEKYVWDATSATVDNQTDDRSMIHAFYRPTAGNWNRSAEFSQYSIEFLSDMFFPYPYPHMTAMEGVIGGGMEFPMMTLIGRDRTERSLFGVTFHEISHMWFPMVVGQDEKSFAWMDEGLTSYNTTEAHRAFWNDSTVWYPEKHSYFRIAGTGFEVESMRHSDQYPYGTPARGVASYNKPSVALNALRGIIGEEDFMKAYREYANRWTYKHPTPYDLFNTFNDVLDQDLDWFWTTMFFETWTHDLAVGNVEQNSDGVFVTVEDKGLSPMPAVVRVTYEDGSTTEQTIPVTVWLGGARETTLTFDPGSAQKVEIDPAGYLPDVDRENNVWP